MILTRMRELVERRALRFEPTPISTFFPLSELKSMTWIGTCSWANQDLAKRWIDDALVIDLFGIPQIPPEVGRDYLRAKYTEKRRHTTEQFSSINMPRAAPLYAKIGIYEDMALVDLTAAYWNITRIVGWDVDYHPSRWLAKRSDMDDFPIPENKLARNSLVSAGLVTPQHIWDGEKLISIKAHSTLINYDIWSLAQDVLHALATIALKAGAVHIHTDGWIIPRKRAAQMINECHRWGLPATIKDAGDCIVKGVGAYKIGTLKTKKVYNFTPQNINSVYEPDIAFLRPRISKLARTAIDWSVGEDTYKIHGIT